VRSLLRRTRVASLYAGLFLVISIAAIWLALLVTPLQSVSAAGQAVKVGATSPSLTMSGPGELDLFGQAIPTKPQFDGPIRPRLQLTHITMDSEVVRLVRSDSKQKLEVGLSQQLTSGWKRYFVWETVVAVGFAAVLLVAVAGIRHYPRGIMLKVLGVGLVTVCVTNVGGILLTASSTPHVLGQVKTLDDLVGQSPLQPTPRAAGPALQGVQAIVLGDSTAAAIGNPLVAGASPLDRACGRSSDSYASDLAAANGWNVLNLACSGATVNAGVLGVQVIGGKVAPPQLAVAERATSASTFILSVGANDLQWTVMAGLCAAVPVCNDQASTAYFQKELATFDQDYYGLLGQLANLPTHPTVIVNQYYNPFGADVGCLKSQGMTPAKVKVLVSRLGELNTILGQGAKTYGFTAVQPRFEGHEFCTDQPFVQGMHDKAPLHPTAGGELAIALADQQALPNAR
jgi:lysophospholipase L1-like esterase